MATTHIAGVSLTEMVEEFILESEIEYRRIVRNRVEKVKQDYEKSDLGGLFDKEASEKAIEANLAGRLAEIEDIREFIIWKMFPKITFKQLIKEINSQLEYYQAEYNQTHQLFLKLKTKLETFERRCS